ncbi:MAG: bile acid:sodium symporter family protein [Rubinisphaera brasiliensis]|uniref:bile acid:sodium symporter family protein n=1 Tax=Rubinisphaera brasiliensis TaxID=119 RepID=UPI00391C2C42
MGFVRRHWFLFALLILIPAGMLGGQSPAIANTVERLLSTQVVVFGVLFAMSFTLKLEQIRRTALRPWAAMFAVLVNLVVLPLTAWLVSRWDAAGPFAAGLLIVGVVPSTLASAAVWTRRAGGNDAIPLLVTLLTNGLCFLAIPFWLWLLLGESVPIDAAALMQRLIWAALLPMALGQMVRFWKPARDWADSRKPLIGMAAQIGILGIVLVGSLRTGPVLLASTSGLSALSIAAVGIQCFLIHAAGLLVAWLGCRAVSASAENTVGVMFAGSQKTLPIAVDLATSPLLLATGLSPLAILPPLTFHVLQLIVDTVVAERAAAFTKAPETDR